MKAVEFKDQTIVFGNAKSNYPQFPAAQLDDPEKSVVGCWKMSFIERIKVLFTGRVWMRMWTSYSIPMPHVLSVHRKGSYLRPGDKEYER